MSYINAAPEYQTYKVPEWDGNPCVAAIRPPPMNVAEALGRLTLQPAFSETDLKLAPVLRSMLPPRLKRFFFPTSKHLRLLNEVYVNVFDGYRARKNPLSAEGQRFLHEAGLLVPERGNPDDSCPGASSTITLLVGFSGTGKSALMRAALRALGKPVIRHSSFHGASFPETQILYLARNVPDQIGSTALCKSYGAYADMLLDDKLFSKSFARPSLKRQDFVTELANLVKTAHVGALVLDEFQNISAQRSGGEREILRLLLNFRDCLGVPIFLVGTHKSFRIFQGGEFSTLRRIVDGGLHELSRPSSPDDPDWKELCSIVWDYQWVTNAASFTKDTPAELYEFSQGITAVMLNLFIAAQMQAIESGSERVDADLLRAVYEERFRPLHPVLRALRSGAPQLLESFDDLYLAATKEVNKDSLMSRMDEIARVIAEREDRELGIVGNGAPRRKDGDGTSGPLSQATARELLGFLGGEPARCDKQPGENG